mgnify:CR=1 FL=1
MIDPIGYQTSGDFDAVLAQVGHSTHIYCKYGLNLLFLHLPRSVNTLQSRSTVSQLNTLVGSLKKSVDVLGTERDTQDFRRKL